MVTLAKFVLSAIPDYSMQTTHLPRGKYYLWFRFIRAKYKCTDVLLVSLFRQNCSHFWCGSQVISPGILVRSMVRSDGQWDWAHFQHLLPQNVLDYIDAVKPPFFGIVANKPGWRWETNSLFTIKFVYAMKTLNSGGNNDENWQILQRFRCPQWVKAFLCLVCKGRVLTNGEHARRYLTDSIACVACGVIMENIDHIFRHCTCVTTIWFGIIPQAKLPIFFSIALMIGFA
ncbi:hypothetical protein GQ457_01G021110 [Hibiscus cannabinus]